MLDTIILIPYRDRKQHLEYFLKNLWPLIKSIMSNVKLVIIEQEEGKLFNRGKLLNIGFKEYENKTQYFITHDVDTIPTIEIITEHYLNRDDVHTVALPHNQSLGGVTKFSIEAIKKVNGFPNNIWGWGIEDRALYYRCIIAKINMSHSNLARKEFKFLPHRSNQEEYKNEKKVISDMWRPGYIDKLSEDEKQKLINYSGLNDLDYNILERYDLEENVEVIKVSI